MLSKFQSELNGRLLEGGGPESVKANPDVSGPRDLDGVDLGPEPPAGRGDGVPSVQVKGPLVPGAPHADSAGHQLLYVCQVEGAAWRERKGTIG